MLLILLSKNRDLKILNIMKNNTMKKPYEDTLHLISFINQFNLFSIKNSLFKSTHTKTISNVEKWRKIFRY